MLMTYRLVHRTSGRRRDHCRLGHNPASKAEPLLPHRLPHEADAIEVQRSLQVPPALWKPPTPKQALTVCRDLLEAATKIVKGAF